MTRKLELLFLTRLHMLVVLDSKTLHRNPRSFQFVVT